MKKCVIFILSLFIAAIAVDSDEKETTLTQVGDVLPQFSTNTIDGDNINSSQFSGQVVLINFFATWCGPCMAELPLLEEKIWKKYKDKGLIVLAIGRQHNLDELIKFNAEKKFGFKIAADPQRHIYQKFATKYIPRNILIDKSGKIAYQSVGFGEDEFQKLIQRVENLLSTKKFTEI